MRSGKAMPVDVGVVDGPECNVAAMADSAHRWIDGYVITATTPLQDGYRAFVPHFAACPERAGPKPKPTPPTLFDTPVDQPEETPR